LTKNQKNTMKHIDAINKILDENNNSAVEFDGIAFEQVALIPHKSILYALLEPKKLNTNTQNSENYDNEIMVFSIDFNQEKEEYLLNEVEDLKILESIYDIYLELYDEARMNHKSE